MSKTSLLPAATLPLSGAELLPIVQGGVSKKVGLSALPDSAAIIALRSSLKLSGELPTGWVIPNEYTGVAWTEVWPWKRYSDGLYVWRMMPDNAATRASWRIDGAPRLRNPDDGIFYVGVLPAAVFDPTQQGVATVERTVHVNTGSNANVGSDALPFKTVDYGVAVFNALGPGTYRLIVKSNDFIPANSEGWDATSYTLGAGVKIKIDVQRRADGSKPWWLPGMRRTNYAKANFAWADAGDGWFICSTLAISAAAKNTPIVVDLSVLDADGRPTPSEGLTGVHADLAAVKAAANGRPAFYRHVATETFYCKLASGNEPDPGNNFAYVENQSAAAFLLSEGARFMLEGVRMVHNTSVVSNASIYLRQATVVLGPTQPVVEHDIQAVLYDNEFYCSSGNGILAFDVARCIVQGNRTGYCWLDAVSQHTFYAPGNSNGPAMGAAQHMFVNDHIDDFHGPNGFKDQPTVNTSSNGPTTHSRCNMEIDNSRFAHSHGSCAAVVGGAKILGLNVNLSDPNYVAPSEDVFAACYLSSGNSAYDVNIKSEFLGLFCTGSARPNARDFYVGPTGKMIQANYRNRSYRKQVQAGGILQDGYGNAL